MKLGKIFASISILALMLSILPVQFSANAATSELFFSEYIEGSSNNKALEIYNGTGAAVDLAAGGYNVFISFNGGTSTLTINLTGTVADGDVFVLAQASANATILAQADQTNGAGWFNGDDAVLLRKGTTVVDAIGQVGFDPGTEWGTGITSTADNTLRRKADVCAGDTDSSNAFDPTVEWDGFATDTFDGLGAHTANCAGVLDPTINEFVFNHAGTDTNEYTEVFGSSNTDYSAYSLLQFEGDGAGAGVIDSVTPVGTTDANGFWFTGFLNNQFENGTVTLLLVEGFTGAVGNDLDTNNDGTLDAAPWTRIVDDVAASDGGATDRAYSTVVLGPAFAGGSFAPGGASRIPNGTDTNSVADWTLNDFDGYGLPGFVGSPAVGEAVNTPGATNTVITVPTDPFGVCGAPATSIHTIQGSGLVTPDLGSVRAVEAVVVATFQGTDQIGGYFLQEEDTQADADPLTSEGLRVFDTSNTPAVGDVVRVRGSVAEFSGLTELNNVVDFAVCSSGGVATPATVTLPVTSVDDLERYEGMAVTFPQALVISEYFNYDRFGEIVLTSRRHLTPTAEFEPGSPEQMQAVQDFLLDRITLDDGRSAQNPDPAIHPNGAEFTLDNLFRGGDTVANVTGVMDYAFGLYRVQPTLGADYSNENPRTAQPQEVGGGLKVASFNVLNYFTTIDTGDPVCGPAQDQDCRGADTPEEFTRQRNKIIAALTAINADVVGLIEIENNPTDGPTADLVSGLNDEMGAGTYDYIATGAIGTDAIRVAFIYKPVSVTPVGNYAILDASVDPRFLDDFNRPALAQTFQDDTTGGIFTVTVNHLKSKGSDCNTIGDPDIGDGQGNCNQTRKAAAQALVDWLATDPTGSGDEDFLIIGDLNSYDKEDPIDAIKAGPDDTPGTGDDYTDMVFTYQGEDAYSYVFDGQTGYLDHALASPGLVDEITGVTDWHINADEPDLIDYDMTFKQDAQDALYSPDPYRSSDHDPVIIGLDVCDEIAPTIDVSVSPDVLWPPNHKYVDVTATVVVSDDFDPNPTLTFVSAVSNEADDDPGPEDGNTTNDIVVVDDTHFQLRAERSDVGTGRVYTITYLVTDACGNSTTGTANVTVPLQLGD